jgi:hypothetical protein
MRKGMWAVGKDGKVGIVNAIGVKVKDGDREVVRADLVEFHQVAKDGTTSLAIVKPLAELRQARYSEIPDSRRSHMKRERFSALGYK